jgi:hypothetical protein
MKIHKLFGAAALATGLLLGPGMASALPMVIEPETGRATGITDLEVGGILYDVVFRERTTALVVYGGVYDPDNQGDASAAATAINSLLSTAGISVVGPTNTDNDDVYYIGFIGVTDVLAIQSTNSAPWTNDGTTIVGGSSFNATFAQFTRVPEPAAAWLLGSGLIGLIGFARSKKA